MAVCLDLQMFYTTFYVVFKILGKFCPPDAEHGWSTEQFIHHLNISRHADLDHRVDRDLVLLTLYSQPYKTYIASPYIANSSEEKTIGLSIKTKKKTQLNLVPSVVI